jgi:hypothetical protein
MHVQCVTRCKCARTKIICGLISLAVEAYMYSVISVLTTSGYTEVTKVRVNRHLEALTAALRRGGRLRGVAHERQARMPRLDVSG